MRLRDTVLMPEFRNNLISVPRITDNNYVVIFRKNRAIIKRPDAFVSMTAKCQEQLYLINEDEENSFQPKNIH